MSEYVRDVEARFAALEARLTRTVEERDNAASAALERLAELARLRPVVEAAKAADAVWNEDASVFFKAWRQVMAAIRKYEEQE